MRAVVADEAGGPEVLRVAELPEPRPQSGEVVIDVVAAGVNRADLLQRQGFYPPPPGASSVLGLECSGVVATGGGGWEPGDRVCALLTGGGYAEQVAVPAGQVMPLPPGVDLVEAAGIPEVACTVYSNLAMVAGLQPGEWVLIHGGGGGIGTFAIQWAVALGARVAVTVGSAEKAARCAALGAEVVINYRDQDFADVIRELTDGRGVDVILDVIGAKYLAANVAALATGGRLVVIGLQGGVRGELDLGALLMKRASIHATSLRSRPPVEKAAICAAVVEHVWPWYGTGEICPVTDRVLPLVDAARAHEAMGAGDHVGKIILRR
ncbi:MAG: NAD(P)H-quinone oxidoreductase [Candidatus Nanopelagicales bacterium]